jgi:excisionase family DNA binding protein
MLDKFILSSIPLDELVTVISETVKKEVESATSFRKPESESEYITRQDAARILGISLPTLNDWSKRGVLPSYRIQSRVRYKKAEVLDSLKQVQTIKYRRGDLS